VKDRLFLFDLQSKDLGEYDPAAQAWNFRNLAAEFPDLVPDMVQAAVVLEGKIVLLMKSSGILAYDPDTHAWMRYDRDFYLKDGFLPVVLGDRLYILSPYQDPNYSFGFGTGTWIREPDFALKWGPVNGAIAADGKIYFFTAHEGNLDSEVGGAGYTTVQAYNPQTRTWEVKESIRYYVGPTRSIAVSGGKIYIKVDDKLIAYVPY
jgi:hypothetical protein